MIPELKHHSASSINSFIEYRPDWFLARIRGIYSKAGVAASRGTAVEAGINHYIEQEKGDVKECIKHALEVYTKDSIGSPENFDIRQSIGPCVIAGVQSFEDRGYIVNPPKLQAEINCKLPGCKKGVYGKLDYLFDDSVVDNKVTAKTPSALKQGYVLQGAIYRFATDLPVRFHFIIPQKTGVKIKEIELTDDDYAFGLELATKAAQNIELIFDRISEFDGSLLEALFFTNPSAVWDYTTKQLHSEQFGIKIPKKNVVAED